MEFCFFDCTVTYTFTIDESPRHEDSQILSQGLTEHASSYMEVPGFNPLAVFLKDEAGEIKGGVLGYVNWQWLSISLLWVPDELRGHGYGQRLMEKIETNAMARGCRYAHLDTFSFQARPFYEALGYRVFCTLDDYPQGHQRFYMKKTLERKMD